MLALFVALVVAPVLFVMFMWLFATAYRIYFPEDPMPFYEEAVAERERLRTSGKYVSVGVREIREDQRRLHRHRTDVSYQYAASVSEGFPPGWMDDLWQRRN